MLVVLVGFEWIKHYFSVLYLVFLHGLLPKKILSLWGFLVVLREEGCCLFDVCFGFFSNLKWRL